ncbi:hypothetical protein [Nocardioides sp. SR21]|uniref:hypothetical protein n=1 Tax=Nocardioides sp. SR21 TaxID=2919501 RepID=UPI001FAAFE35|nr:hypothetical protein [Nocardioides sp. SR21]
MPRSSHVRMTPVQDRRHAGQWFLFCGECGWQSVQLNRTLADIAISQAAPHHLHDNNPSHTSD